MNNNQYFFIKIFLVLFGVWGICYGDYWEYGALVQQAYEVYQRDKSPGWYTYIHMEPIYDYLAVLCQGNYYLWRLIVYSLEFLGVTYILKGLYFNNYKFLLIFSIFALQSICGGRVSWGIAFYWLGIYAYFETKQRKYLLFVAASFLAHNSMIFMLLLLPFMFVKINRVLFLILVVLTPTLALYLNNSLENIFSNIPLLNSLSVADILNHRLQGYLQGDEELSYWGKSVLEKVHSSLFRLPLYYMIILLFRDYFSNRIEINKTFLRVFPLMCFLFLYTCLVIIGNINSASLYHRYFMMLYLPVFLLTYGLNGDYYMQRKDYRICLYLLGTSFVALYLKAIYYYSVHDTIIRLQL